MSDFEANLGIFLILVLVAGSLEKTNQSCSVPSLCCCDCITLVQCDLPKYQVIIVDKNRDFDLKRYPYVNKRLISTFRM